MRTDRDHLVALLRWYPAPWRDRYGAELVALMEDDLDGRRPTVAYRISMATSGLGQRARAAGLAGDGAAPEVRVRSGALLVLVSWSALMLGGAAFAKASEHYGDAVQAQGHPLAVIAFHLVRVAAIIGTALVLVGASVGLPAASRYLRGGGWSSVGRLIALAVALTVVVAAVTTGVAHWAHHLTFRQRNGGDAAYGIAVLGWALLVAATLGAWTWIGVRMARRTDLGARALRVEAYLSVSVAAAVGVVSTAVGVWWVAMAHGAAWFLAGTRPGTHPSPVTAQMLVIETWLVAVTAMALFGATRVIRSVRVA